MSLRIALAETLRERARRLSGRLRRLAWLPTDADAAREYSLAKTDNAKVSALYQAGAFWSAINREYADLIWGGALEELRDRYLNHRFSGPPPESYQVYCGLINLYHSSLKARAPELIEQLDDTPIGGSRSLVEIEGRRFSLDMLQSAEELLTVREALTIAGLPEPRIYVELGAGYGRIAYVLRRLWPNCTYVILDLPEALTCAHSWLSRVSEANHVIPYSRNRRQGCWTREGLIDGPNGPGKIWLLGAHQIERLEDGIADVFANVYSLAEMPRASVENYYRHIGRVTRGVFYTKQREREVNAADATVNEMGAYPELPGASVLVDRPAMLYPGIRETAYRIP